MAALSVTVERLTIHEHPNADALELAQVGLYRAVVPKGQYQSGDLALYIPEQAVLPPTLIAELGLTDRLAGKQANRVKAVRLRGELSQGVVCRPHALEGIDTAHAARERIDFAELLGITKWQPPIPAVMAGQVEPAPDLIRWIDIENIKRYPNIFTPGEPVIATEKLHGTACLLTYDRATAITHVSSKGMGSQHLAILPDDRNLYWRAVQTFDLVTVATNVASSLSAQRVGLFGEVYGQGVQDLAYGANAGADSTLGYALFDIATADELGVRWLNHDEITDILAAVAATVPRVPLLYRGPYDETVLLALAEGPETVTGDATHIREGLVVRPQCERDSELLGGRAIGKLVSEAYLCRKGGTEYE